VVFSGALPAAGPVTWCGVVAVRQAPNGEACFCDLADQFDMPRSSLSHHLKILVQAGILERERRGTWSWYRPSREPWEVMEHVMRPGGPLRDGIKPRKRRSRPADC
jgi:ArsR family transcriptional regulator